MANIYQSVTELIGHTPLLAAKSFVKEFDLPANILVKLEYFNPAGSVKDRIAIAMIEQAERDGKIAPGATLIEPTSGHRPCRGRGGTRLPCNPYDARDDEC